MSDTSEDRDPMDKAYGEAEAVLADEAARAARRARVLAAVAQVPVQPERAAAAPLQGKVEAPPERPRFRPGQWLIAASAAGVAVLAAVQIYKPVVEPPAAPQAAQSPQPLAPPAAEAAADAAVAPQAAEPAPAGAVRQESARAQDSLAQAPAPPRAQAFEPQADAAPVLMAPAPPPPPPAPAAPMSSFAERRAAAPADGAPAPRPSPSITASAQASAEPDLGEVVVTGSRRAKQGYQPRDGDRRLLAAAAQGRITAIETLLQNGVAVDVVDDDGETPLMKAIQARKPSAAALLVREGADLDAENYGGVTARDMARAINDPALNRALGLRP